MGGKNGRRVAEWNGFTTTYEAVKAIGRTPDYENKLLRQMRGRVFYSAVRGSGTSLRHIEQLFEALRPQYVEMAMAVTYAGKLGVTMESLSRSTLLWRTFESAQEDLKNDEADLHSTEKVVVLFRFLRLLGQKSGWHYLPSFSTDVVTLWKTLLKGMEPENWICVLDVEERNDG